MEFSNNKRAQDSQRAIYKGLRRLLERKDLKDITVVVLQNECNISRATFYRNYRNIIDVLDVIFKWYFNEYQELKKEENDKLLFFFRYWYLHRDLLTIIVENNLDIIKNCMIRDSKPNTDPYFIEIKYGLVTSIIVYWSKERKTSPEELYEKVKRMLDVKAYELITKN